MKPIEYMSKQELLGLTTAELKAYLGYTLDYDLDIAENYSRAEVIQRILEDNKSRRKLAKLNPSS